MRILLSKRIVAISKPRCGSTSVRRALDPFLVAEKGDVAVNNAGERPPFHPHMTAPHVKEVLRLRGLEPSKLSFFITVRNPIDMLESYYKFFQPDSRSEYNYSPKWSGGAPMEFEEWITHGRVGMHPDWERLAPAWVSTCNLSPLSLEAHAENAEEILEVDHIFKIEEPSDLEEWLSERLGKEIQLKSVNQSKDQTLGRLSARAMERVRKMFPAESRIYGL